MKIHLAFSVANAFGGFTTGHVCGREHSANYGDNNVTCEHSEVTCKLCLKVLANPKHWRYRRYVK